MKPLSLLLEQLTWPEAEAALEAGYRTAVVACGSIEQHGPHLPLFVDAEHGTALALEVAHKLGNTLVAPTIRVGISEHHMGFSGTVTIQESTFSDICHDYVSSLVRHGFERIYFIPTHGGNFGPLQKIEPALNETAGPNANVRVYAELFEVVEVWKGAVEETIGLGDRVGGHADIAETSIMEHLHPDWVRRDRAEAGVDPNTVEGYREKMHTDGIRAVTANGILGDARGATALAGEHCIEALANALVAYFERDA
jgi:creatinine amidohydrolase